MRFASAPGSRLVVSSLLGVLAVLVTGCGSEEPVNGTTSPTDTNEESSSGTNSVDTDGQATEGADDTEANTGATPTATIPDDTLPETPIGVVGIACTGDGDCAAPLTCVRTDDSFRGALPGTGICTMPCDSDNECQAVDALGFCDLIGAPTDDAIAATAQGEVPEGMAAYCLQACPFGVNGNKCDGLSTFTCAPLEAEVTTVQDISFQFGLCFPLCAGDDDCKSGEACDAVWGLCVPKAREGKPLGAKCDPNAELPECAGGLCLGISADLPYGVCSAQCNVHPDTLVCGGEPGPDAEFGCFSNLFTELASAVNDLGQCLPLCDSDADCSDALACDLSAAETFQDLYGRGGVCFPSEDAIAEAVRALSDAGDQSPEPPANVDAGDAG